MGGGAPIRHTLANGGEAPISALRGGAKGKLDRGEEALKERVAGRAEALPASQLEATQLPAIYY